ncbi:Leucine rich repeat 4 [Cynara cardunculus var. scolymus]|uniref:Leucine rich repeat 4 n=1 Tax=Cynara cardunculus var. scolymus TaxID=59895 RepID=A0A103XNG4_CYNCS|nr:Leucine rich repeat 4 [Cynara cardunculus var. scolymus]
MAAVCGHHLSFFLLLSLFPLSCLSQQSPSNALLQLKKSFSKSDSLTNWKDDGSNPCDPNNVWIGIICANGMVSSINLSGMGLEGQPDIGALEVIDGLKAISLENNSFLGPMPQINRLRYLKAFYAGTNQFSGVIPSDFFQTLGSLKKLWLQHNKFSGQIPISVGELPNLKELHLEYNEFSGPIPAFSDPDIITNLDLSNNKLEGEIPKSLNQFDAKVFENNADLCGPQLEKECKAEDSTQPDVEPSAGPKSSTKWIIMIVVVALLILIILAKANRIEEDHVRPSGGSMGDLVMVNEERGVFGLHDLMKAAAEVLGNGGLGSAYKAMLGNGVSVVVKRVKEMNQMTKDVFDAEIIKGVARGMGFLHSEFASYDLPHGNLKSSNVLIGNDYEPLLSDYAFYPLVNQTPTAQCMFAFKSPEAMLNQKISAKSDVYCMGIIILEIMTGKYPSQYFNNQKGGTDVVQWVRSALAEKREKELIDPEIASGARESVGEMEKLLHIGAACTESDVEQRMELNEAIRKIEEISV